MHTKILLPAPEIIPFDELDLHTLYDVLHLRAQVFVVEQECAYQDVDYWDLQSLHVILRRPRRPAAYARIILPGDGNKIYIGRVLTHPAYRRQGLATYLLQFILDYIHQNYPSFPVLLSAQTYLTGFYERMGFRKLGNEYMEDGIPHIKMILKK